ncbi:MAG: HAD-IIB family hydrolase [Bacteroidetes bacterium]|nr:HAD-IIB family hydrolase [Bacteroidota bacterium]
MLESLSKAFFRGFRRTPEERLRAAKLVACDLDGTLLNREERIAPSSVALIKQVEQLGIRFVLITRRHHQAVEPYAEELQLAEPIISLDGALTCALHADAPLDTAEFDQDFALDITDEIALTDDVDCWVVTPSGFFTAKADTPLPWHHVHWNIETEVIPSFEGLARQGKILEIVASGSFHGVNAIYNYVEKKMRRDELKLRLYESNARSDQWYLEVRANAATKDTALGRLLARYDVDYQEVIGIGDNYNDLEFCRKAGYVVAVRNAVEPLLQMADYITQRDFNHEGVDEFLQYFLVTRGAIAGGAPVPATKRRPRSR